MQACAIPFGGRLAVTPLPMMKPELNYSHDAQRGIWDISGLKEPSILTNTTYQTKDGDSGEDEAH